MGLDDFLNKTPFRLLRNVAATVKAISFCSSPVIAVATLISYLISSQIQNNVTLWVISLAALLSMTAMLSVLCYYILHVCDPAPYEIMIIEGLLIIERSAGHHHRYTNRREQTVKARRNNVRLVEHRTHWTGSGSKNRYRARSLSQSQQLFIAPHAEEDGRIPHWMYLGRPLCKGDSETVGFEEMFEDNHVPMLPYYREGGGRYRTRTLKITVRFSIDEDPGSVDGLVWNNDRKDRQRHIVGEIAVLRRANLVARSVDYTVVVRRPKRYHSYGVRWRWPSPPGTSAQPGNVSAVTGHRLQGASTP